ncbi:polymer-forming cytoskeletal protein [Sphingosinicella sp. BN140058]|uniref:bactofilin family protein n=1 Tax=Sphingosinicella sp. BN140058 TaxID=1892855 RepID=UPI0010101D54|nr:polymer-forming cytoskeletal protein [Sphingosinicella sp. BN140058]QAY75961.1 polymer-forming cytoskeletal protein [Sphingosinicella sp. BN140058]
MFARGAKTGREFSFIGPDVTVTGNIVTDGRLHVDGTVTGDIRCGSLTQGSSGAVHGNIVAEEAELAGLVDGAVEAGTLTLAASARITGDVLYETVGIAAGAQVEGRFRRRKGPSDHGASAAREEGLRAISPPPSAMAERASGGERPVRQPTRRSAPRRPEPAELFAHSADPTPQIEAAE